jgi:hypothetical protein
MDSLEPKAPCIFHFSFSTALEEVATPVASVMDTAAAPTHGALVDGQMTQNSPEML